MRHDWLALAALVVSMHEAGAAPLRFHDVTADAGIAFVHDQPLDHQSGPMTGGAAVGDFNGDGWPDLFVLGGGGRPDAVYINTRDGRFVDRAAQWSADKRHRGVGVTVGDYDGDGDDDVFVTSLGPMTGFSAPGHHRLYRNDGGVFTEVAQAAGVAATTTTHPDGYGAAFGDYDLDGDLDLFVGAWHNAAVFGSRLFRNRGDGTFENVTEASGLNTGSTRAFGAVWADMDGDRYPELLIAGDFGTNRYLRNDGDGTFTELDPATGLARAAGADWGIGNAWNGMGTTVGDFDGDGRLDWFVTAIWPTHDFASDFWGNGLYLNHGGHVFSEIGQGAGVSDGGWGWGTQAADFDNDGHTDLVMTNGWPDFDITTGTSFAGEQAYLWRNRGDLTFEETAKAAGLTHTGQGRALLTLDYDRDGALDIFIADNVGDAHLYRNATLDGRPTEGRWLQVALDTRRHPHLAPHGAGARISVSAGGRTQTQQLTTGGTYLGQSELVAHVGLGSARVVDTLAIEWPNGERAEIRSVRADRRFTVKTGCLPPRADGPRWRGKRRSTILLRCD